MKKAVVIPHHVYHQMLKSMTNNQPAKSHSTPTIEEELKLIHTSEDPIEKKNFLYQQALFKYLQSTHADKKDLILPVLGESTLPSSPKVAQQEFLKNGNTSETSVQHTSVSPSTIPIIDMSKSEIDETMQETLSKRNKQKGMHLYNMLRNRGKGKVSWNDIGEIFINDRRIPNSNIIDIVADLLNSVGKASPPRGFIELVPYLRAMNIPLHLLRSRARSKAISNAITLDDTSSAAVPDPKLLGRWKKF